MDYIAKTVDIIQSINKLSVTEKKKTGFLIGNTAKVDKEGVYFTPVRISSNMVLSGVIVYSEDQAIRIAKELDGKVDYIIVDVEKKVADSMSLSGESANIERAVRQSTYKSKLWVYKGNDLSVEAVDSLLAYIFKDSLRGLGNRKIAIVGGGNLGSKLALKLVERGANVFISRRNKKKLEAISHAINLIKPNYTYAKVEHSTDNLFVSNKAEILIGTTNGVGIIDANIINKLKESAIVIDVGKGTLTKEGLLAAEKRGLNIYRLDITASLFGMLETQLEMECIVEEKMGRLKFNGENIVSGGLLGRKDEIIVDSIDKPSIIYGIANGRGDFIRDLSPKQIDRLKKIDNFIKK